MVKLTPGTRCSGIARWPGERPVELHLPRAFGQHLQFAVAGHSQRRRGASEVTHWARAIAKLQGSKVMSVVLATDCETSNVPLPCSTDWPLSRDSYWASTRPAEVCARQAGSGALDRLQQAFELVGLHGQILHVALGPRRHPLGKVDAAESAQVRRRTRFSAVAADLRGRRRRRQAASARSAPGSTTRSAASRLSCRGIRGHRERGVVFDEPAAATTGTDGSPGSGVGQDRRDGAGDFRKQWLPADRPSVAARTGQQRQGQSDRPRPAGHQGQFRIDRGQRRPRSRWPPAIRPDAGPRRT